jgi:S-adenosyl-L-methionine hydrolase (adenosine-forming)
MIITLTTDFGYSDPFVGILKGVILGIHADAQIVDLTHGIPAQNVLAGALALWSSVGYFPPGTIHVVVVDPGVGGDRRPILMQLDSDYFIGPDNGVLSLALEDRKPTRIVQLSNDAYHLQPKSRTFHGRDVFAPVAAYLARGTSPEILGDAINGFVQLPWPKPKFKDKVIEGEVLYIDRFGNLFTNVRERDLTGRGDKEIVVRFGSVEITEVSANYTAGENGEYIALINSWGLLEIALCRDNAAMRSGISVGDTVEIVSRR